MSGELRGLTAREFGRPLFWLPEVDSTNRYLKERGSLLPGGAVCCTGRQTAGRGRLGRSWTTPAGEALALSLLVKPAAHTAQLALLCGLAASRAMTRLAGPGFGIKWPNDIVCRGKKICGILCEACWPDETGFAVAGVGFNLRQTAEEFRRAGLPHAASVEMLTGNRLTLEETAAAFLNEMEPLWNRLRREGFSALRGEYEARCVTVGRAVRVLNPDGSLRLEGTALGVAEDGSLLVDGGGSTVSVCAGEVSVRGRSGYAY
ncbi:MAG TPA: biotin--[acetyl-CoA-carboxylase] ligase [Firmicutes bacterium]|nr:biotin--[acetyl-CoA-carboxylase] ligase [Bacillota bacterium]